MPAPDCVDHEPLGLAMLVLVVRRPAAVATFAKENEGNGQADDIEPPERIRSRCWR
jgi:hypothetical protein